MYSHTDARYMTHLSLCTPQEEEGTGKALKWTRNSALFFLLPLRRCQDIFHNFAHECSVHLCVLSCQCTATVSPSETHL